MCTTFNMRLKNTTPKYVSSKKTHVWFSPKKKRSLKKLRKKKNIKHTKLFPKRNIAIQFRRVFRVFRVPGSHRHELQLEAHDHQIKPRGWFQPSARPALVRWSPNRSPELTNCLGRKYWMILKKVERIAELQICKSLRLWCFSVI